MGITISNSESHKIAFQLSSRPKTFEIKIRIIIKYRISISMKNLYSSQRGLFAATINKVFATIFASICTAHFHGWLVNEIIFKSRCAKQEVQKIKDYAKG